MKFYIFKFFKQNLIFRFFFIYAVHHAVSSNGRSPQTRNIYPHLPNKKMDLLGSIMGSMEKPPSLNDADKKKAKGLLLILKLSSNSKG